MADLDRVLHRLAWRTSRSGPRASGCSMWVGGASDS